MRRVRQIRASAGWHRHLGPTPPRSRLRHPSRIAASRSPAKTSREAVARWDTEQSPPFDGESTAARPGSAVYVLPRTDTPMRSDTCGRGPRRGSRARRRCCRAGLPGARARGRASPVTSASTCSRSPVPVRCRACTPHSDTTPEYARARSATRSCEVPAEHHSPQGRVGRDQISRPE